MGPHDDDGSGVTLAVALRATPVVPATAAATAAATPTANSENFLFNAPSSIVRPECVLPREEPNLPSDLRWGSISRPGPGFKMGRSLFPGRTGQAPEAAYNAGRSRRWRNWSTRWPQKPLSFGTCGFESHPPHQTVDHARAVPGRAAMTRARWRRRSACSPAEATAPA